MLVGQTTGAPAPSRAVKFGTVYRSPLPHIAAEDSFVYNENRFYVDGDDQIAFKEAKTRLTTQLGEQQAQAVINGEHHDSKTAVITTYLETIQPIAGRVR